MIKEVKDVLVRNTKSGRTFSIPEKLTKDSVYMKHHGLQLAQVPFVKPEPEDNEFGMMELPPEVASDMGIASTPKRGRKKQTA